MAETLEGNLAVQEAPRARALEPVKVTAHTPPPPRRRSWIWTLVLLAIAAGCGYWAAAWNSSADTRETLPGAAPHSDADRSAVTVTAEPVVRREVQRTVEAVGSLFGFEEISISVKIDGRISKIHRDVADRVAPGDLLLQIEPVDYELSLKQSESALRVELTKLGLDDLPGPDFDINKVPMVMQAAAKLEHVDAKLQRMRRLASSRSVSSEDLDSATSDYRIAQAEQVNQVHMAKSSVATIQMKQSAIAVAQQQLKETSVRTPRPTLTVPGISDSVTYVVSQRSAAEGAYVKTGAVVYKLVIDRMLKLRVPVPERYSADVQVGQKVNVSCSASAKYFPGVVARINPSVDPATRTFEVEVLVPNLDGRLKPGGFARAAILTRLESGAPTVPLSSVVSFAGVNKIFLADHGKARAIPVTLGLQTTSWVEIVQPALPPDAQVITSGQTALALDTDIVVRSAQNADRSRKSGD